MKERVDVYHPVNITDLDFADDIALLSDEIEQAKQLLARVEEEAAKIGLHVNSKKTEHMMYNQEKENAITSKNGVSIKTVDDFKYLGGWMKSTEQDVKVRLALA